MVDVVYDISDVQRYQGTRKWEATELIINIHANLNSNHTSSLSPITPKISIQQQAMNIDPKTVPQDLKEIQPHPYQVWNCDEIGFNPNGSWLRVAYTYILFTGIRIWKYQTGERSPFWCTALIFTRYDGQCFMTPLIVHQAENCNNVIHWNPPSDWLVQNTTSGYIERDGWMKAMSLFSRTCVSNKINPQDLFFYRHGINFDDRATHFLQSNHISLFIFKAGHSTNDHPNDNGPNLKLKIYCGIEKVKWQRQHGTTKFTPTHNFLFSWRCGICFNNNKPLSSLMPF